MLFFICFSEEIYSELAFLDIVVMTKGYFQTRKHSQEGFCPAFSYFFEQYDYDCKSWHHRNSQAGAVFVLASYLSWLSRLAAALWPGEESTESQGCQCHYKQHESHGISEPPILTTTCWFRACFLIRGQETRGLFSSKEKAKFGEKREIQSSSTIATTGGNLIIWILDVNLSLKEKNQNWSWYLNNNKKEVAFTAYIGQKSKHMD